MKFLGSEARQARHAQLEEYYKNPARCGVCGGPLSYRQHKRRCKTCGNICGRTITAGAKIGRPNPHGPKLPTTAEWNGKIVGLRVETDCRFEI